MIQSTIKLTACFFCGEPSYINQDGACDECSLGFEDMIELHSDRFLEDDTEYMNPILSDDQSLSDSSREELVKLYKEADESPDLKTIEAVEIELSRRS